MNSCRTAARPPGCAQDEARCRTGRAYV